SGGRSGAVGLGAVRPGAVSTQQRLDLRVAVHRGGQGTDEPDLVGRGRGRVVRQVAGGDLGDVEHAAAPVAVAPAVLAAVVAEHPHLAVHHLEWADLVGAGFVEVAGDRVGRLRVERLRGA